MDDRLKVRELLTALLRHKGDLDTFGDDESLVTSGRLESVDSLELVLFLEENYGIDFAEGGFDQNELDSVNSIIALIGGRRNE